MARELRNRPDRLEAAPSLNKSRLGQGASPIVFRTVAPRLRPEMPANAPTLSRVCPASGKFPDPLALPPSDIRSFTASFSIGSQAKRIASISEMMKSLRSEFFRVLAARHLPQLTCALRLRFLRLHRLRGGGAP